MTQQAVLLGGRYRLIGVLGEGGMAVVHRAHDEVLERDVAVKVLRLPYAADPDFVARFRAEARNAAALEHPNIAPIFDTGVDDGRDYIVMQLVDGPDLASVLAERGRLPVAEALQITLAVAEALAAAHGRGIVHRDIKPGNVLLTSDGDVRVVDFGIARALGEARTTSPDLLLGSVQYCSPEQVLGEAVGPASDIFSLGIVLHELLTGERPWDGAAPAAVALARLRQPAPLPSESVPELPAGIDALVARALARDPAARYRSAAEMAGAIRGWWRMHRATRGAADPRRPSGSDAPTTVMPIPRPRPAGSRRRRGFPMWIAAAAAALAVLLTGLALSRGDRSPDAGILAATATPLVTTAAAAAPSPAASATAQAPPATPVTPATPEVTPIPTPNPTPPPTPTPAPPTPPPATPPPTPAPPRATPAPPRPVAASGPAAVTARFYDLVEQHRFDEAEALWTAAMRRRYPPDGYIDGRFTPTTRIDLHRNEVVAQDGGSAVVAVDLTEYRTNGDVRRWRGSWDVVLTDAGWLLNDPDF